MHLAHLRLRDFRNYGRLDADFSPGFHLFLGDNAQGKTNLLEAIYLVATLRSFRGVGGAQMVREGQAGYFVGATVLSEVQNECRIYWSADKRNLTLDGRPISRLSDYLGVLRAVVFSSEDLQLIKGPASRRRRYLDLLLTQTHSSYLPLLQRYAQALRARNALLKQPQADETALEGFTRELIEAGEQVLRFRRELLPALAPVAALAHGRLAGAGEELHLEYRPAVKNDFLIELAQSRGRERVYRSTLVGPHRDELLLAINGRPADLYASEGQKRSIAIALKIAQAEYLTQRHGTPPILLIDDILGELDPGRRIAFLPLLEGVDRAGSQVFITATEASWPRDLAKSLRKWTVRTGTLEPNSD